MAPTLYQDTYKSSNWNENHRRQDNKRNSTHSNDSMSSQDSLNEKRTKSDFLNRIKYFEKKTDQEHVVSSKPHKNAECQPQKHVFKETVDEVWSQFPKFSKPKTATGSHSFQGENARHHVDKKPQVPRKPPNVTKEPHVILSLAQPKRLSKGFAMKQVVKEVKTKLADKNIEYVTSSCTNFFSTGDVKFLPEEVPNEDKQFKVILKGILYDNCFYSLNYISQPSIYNLNDSLGDDQFDADL